MVVLAFGGRDFVDQNAVNMALSQLHRKFPISLLREGDARGADRLSGIWAQTNGIPLDVMPADWDRYGKRAGFVRNQSMLDKEPHVTYAVCFPGGNGTMDMARRIVECNRQIILYVPYGYTY